MLLPAEIHVNLLWHSVPTLRHISFLTFWATVAPFNTIELILSGYLNDVFGKDRRKCYIAK